MNKFPIEQFPFLNLSILQSRVSWSITLRWLAVIGYFIATRVAKISFNIQLPYEIIWSILGALSLINLLYLLIFKLFKEFSFRAEIVFLQFHIIIDLIFLTFLIHYSGGIENPIYLFYAFHVVISSIIFPGRSPVIITTFVVLLFSSLVYLEYSGILFHYCIYQKDFHSNEFMMYIILTVFTITVYVTMYICMTFMYIFRNVKRQIDSQHQQLVESDMQKTKFYRFTSHELKSPIVAIKSSIDGVLKNYSGQLDGRAADLLERASARSVQMLEIIRELLELSKSRSGLTEKKGELVDLNKLILEIIEQYKVQADEKFIRIETNLSEKPSCIYGHVSNFNDCLLNLIMNAIRYTRENGLITITTENLRSEIQITVLDTGIGIAEVDLPNIFDEFYRSENAKKEVKIGTGLGLSIVKQIVDNYNGTINVQSTLGKGTRFTLRFPK